MLTVNSLNRRINDVKCRLTEKASRGNLRMRDSIKGDKLRELILLVYLNDRYGLSKKLKVSKLKEILGYSTGGLYNALDESGYFERNKDEIALSEKGVRYAKENLMRQFRAIYPIGYFFLLFGIILIGHWYLLKYHNILLFFDWTVGFSFILGGLLLRLALPAMVFWMLKILRKM